MKSTADELAKVRAYLRRFVTSTEPLAGANMSQSAMDAYRSKMLAKLRAWEATNGR